MTHSLTHSLKHAVRYDDHDGVGDDGDHAKVQHPDRVPKPEGEEDVACKEYSISGGIANVRRQCFRNVTYILPRSIV